MPRSLQGAHIDRPTSLFQLIDASAAPPLQAVNTKNMFCELCYIYKVVIRERVVSGCSIHVEHHTRTSQGPQVYSLVPASLMYAHFRGL